MLSWCSGVKWGDPPWDREGRQSRPAWCHVFPWVLLVAGTTCT